MRGSIGSAKRRWCFGPPEASQQSTVDEAPTVISSDSGWGLPSKKIFPAELDLVDPGQFGLNRSAQKKMGRGLEEGKQFVWYVLSTLAPEMQDVSSVGDPGGGYALVELIPVLLEQRPAHPNFQLVTLNEGSDLVTGDGLSSTKIHHSLDVFSFLRMA